MMRRSQLALFLKGAHRETASQPHTRGTPFHRAAETVPCQIKLAEAISSSKHAVPVARYWQTTLAIREGRSRSRHRRAQRATPVPGPGRFPTGQPRRGLRHWQTPGAGVPGPVPQ